MQDYARLAIGPAAFLEIHGVPILLRQIPGLEGLGLDIETAAGCFG
jgi:hypothetical protein